MGWLTKALAGGLFTAACFAQTTGSVPGRFEVQDENARPIAHSSSSMSAPAAARSSQVGSEGRWSELQKHRIGRSGLVLRWRVPDEEAGSSAAPATKSADAENQRGTSVPATFGTASPGSVSRDVGVRPVAHWEPIDPFEDPFGDRQPRTADRTRSVLTFQPQPMPLNAPQDSAAPADPTADEPSALIPPGTSQRSATEEPAAPERSRILDSTQNPFNDDAPRPDDFLPGSRPGDDQLEPPSDCQSVYNERNCCDEDEQCKEARKRALEDDITKIKLDITPSFKPDESDEAKLRQGRSLKLAKSAIRAWRNRAGEVIARGQMTDFRNGRVFVDQDGQVTPVAFADLSDDDTCFVTAWWGLPTECALGDEAYEPRTWLASTMTWKASALCHKPLYFEDVQLERYGHTPGPLKEPFLSGAHFFLNVAALPYKMAINPPNECQYALGYYRPGSCAPWLVPPIPLSLRGALAETGVIVGGIYVIP